MTGITISEEQHRLARERVAEAGLGDRIDVRLVDYRHVRGTYDKIVSIEMLEAVGHAFYGAYFRACDGLLDPGGRVVLQVITIPGYRYSTYRSRPDWIQPEAHLPRRIAPLPGRAVKGHEPVEPVRDRPTRKHRAALRQDAACLA